MKVTLDHVRGALARPVVRPQVPEARKAAVAAILTPELDLLFIQRALFEGDPWSGHVGFPGGHLDPADADDPIAAAIRETQEEIGVDLGSAELVGELEPVVTPRGLPSKLVTGHVFLAERPTSFDLDPTEVAGVYLRPLQTLLDDEARTSFPLEMRGNRYTMSAVDFQPGVRLWGMTLRMVDDLLNRIDGRGLGLDRLR